MSNAIHTPGPWTVRHKFNVFADKRSIASCGGYTSNDLNEDTYNVSIANARLIAAAPDLLAVAIDIKKYLDFVSSGQPTHGTVERELYYRLQAAIAATKGEK